MIQISLADKILRKNYDEVKQIEFNVAHNETNQNIKIKPEKSDEIKGEGKKDKKEKEKSDETDIDINIDDETDMITNREDISDIIIYTKDILDIDTKTEEEDVEKEEIEEEVEEEIEIEEEEEKNNDDKINVYDIVINKDIQNEEIQFHSYCIVYANISLFLGDKIVLNLSEIGEERIYTTFYSEKWENTSYKYFTGFPVEISTFELQQLGNYDNYTIIFSKDSNYSSDYNLTYYLDIYSGGTFIGDNDFLTTSQSKNFTYKNNFEIYQEDKKILLTVLSNNINYDFNFDYSLNGTPGIINVEKTFFNGYSFIINNDSFKDSEGKIKELLNFSLILDYTWNNEYIEIKTRIIQNLTLIQEHDHFDIFLNSTQNPNECFQFRYPNITYILNFISYTKNIYINGSLSPNLNNTYISKESMSLEKNNTECDIICFQLDEKNNYFNFGSISFEVMPTKNEKDQDIVINNTFKTIRGLWTHY